MPSPARSTGTTTTSPRTTLPSAGPSGVVTVRAGRRHVAQRLGRQQHADAIGGAAERRRRGALVAQLHQRVVHERVIDDVKRHGTI